MITGSGIYSESVLLYPNLPKEVCSITYITATPKVSYLRVKVSVIPAFNFPASIFRNSWLRNVPQGLLCTSITVYRSEIGAVWPSNYGDNLNGLQRSRNTGLAVRSLSSWTCFSFTCTSRTSESLLSAYYGSRSYNERKKKELWNRYTSLCAISFTWFESLTTYPEAHSVWKGNTCSWCLYCVL
jgi:hypothetical protein